MSSAPPSFIESAFTSKVEYEKAMAAGSEIPRAADALADAMANASVAASEAWGPLEYPPARKAALQKEFEEQAGGGRLSLRAVHSILFTADERKEYGFDNFDEDLQASTRRKRATRPHAVLTAHPPTPSPGDLERRMQGRHELGRRAEVYGRQLVTGTASILGSRTTLDLSRAGACRPQVASVRSAVLVARR